MKKIILFIVFCVSLTLNAQVKIGDNPNIIDSNSILELESNERVLVVTRLSDTQMNAVTPLNGAIVYNTDEECLFQFNNNSWNSLCVDVMNKEIITVLVDNNDGSFTYTNEADTLTIIQKASLIDNGDGTFTFDNGDGSPITFNGTNDETVTTLEDNGDGTFTYNSEDGTVTTFDSNSTLVDNGDGTFTHTNAASVSVTIDSRISTILDNGDGTFTVTDDFGNSVIIDTNETVTTLVDNGDGTVTYTDENGIDTIIDLATIIDNYETLTFISYDATTGDVTYTDEDGGETSYNLPAVIANFETTTTIVDNGDGTVTYTDEDGNPTVLDFATMIDNFETLTFFDYDPMTTELTYTDEDGNPNVYNLGALVASLETVTTIVDNGDGTVTYTDEDGNPTVLDFATMIDNFETLTFFDYNPVTTELTYTDEDGTPNVYNLGTLVGDLETVTDVTDLNAATDLNLIGTYNNEEGVPFAINETVTDLAIAAGALTYANEDASNANVNLISGDADNNIVAGTDGALFVDVSAEETVTDVTDLNAATDLNLIGTYNNEEGDPFVINETVTSATQTVLDADGNTISVYTDEEGTPININETVTDLAIAAGALTYANEDASNANVNLISGDADNNIAAGTDGALFVDVSAEETVTDVTDLNAAATTNLIGTYNNEEGDPFVINETVTSATQTVLDADGNTISVYTDEAGIPININETVTDLAIAAGELTYANEDASNANVNLISGDADNNIAAGTDGALFVDVSAEETVTDVTDLNAAATTNLIGTYNNEEGDPFVINETVTSATQTVLDADGNTISVYTDEEGTPININETVTDLAIAAGALTYANEDASNANVNLISTDADNSITAGTDGALFVDVSAEETVTDVTDLNTATDTNVIGTYNNEEGDPFSIEETVTDLAIAAGALTYANEDASNANVNLISTDADNSITAGTDGALFVDVSAEETVTDVTDLNTATDTNVIGTYNNEEGDPFSIEETVTSATQTVADADGNTISVYTDEEGTPININETVTDLGIAAGALTYANEDASNANVNLISTDADNSITAGTDGALFVDVSAEETVTDVTDLNTATDTNVIGTYNNEEGDPFSIEETVTSATQTVADADGNTISVYTDEEGTPININETVTDLDIAAGALTYANEDASNANVNLISIDADNSITAGTDGALFVDVSAEETVTDVTDLNTATDTNVIGTYNNEEDDPFSIEETVTSATQTVADADGNTISVYTDEEGTPININETVTDLGIAAGALTYANEDASNANVNLISADADNSITAGTDGALFVDVSAEETVTDVTDLNTATDTNVIGTYNNEEGDPFSIEETVTSATQTVADADGNTISVYTDEEGTPININETVTDLGIAAGALTYANEDASNANVNLISTDADNSITAGTDGALFVDVSAEETVTDVTDLNTATDTNVIGTYNNEEGDPFSIEETVTSATQTVADADGNTISVYTDEEGTPININETVTDLGIAAGALTYANEDASNANVNLISIDADNSITAGTDGALFVDVSAEETVTDVTDLNTATDTNVIGTYNNEEGDPFSIEETVTSATQTVADADGNTISVYTDEEGTPININETVTDLDIAAGALTYANEDASNANVNLISADADNSITAGTDGALFVDVSAEETVTDVTDLNTATDTNVIGTYNNEEGDPFSIEETVTSATQTVADADGNTISVYTDEEGTPININETVTDLGIAAGALTYANEDASNANVNLISTDADNSITAGTDGALFVDVSAEETVTDVTDLNTATDTNVIGTYNNEEGDPFSIEETVTSATQTVADADGNTISVYTDEEGTPININETVTDLGIAAGALTYANEDASNANVNLISIDADNSITAGTDGALFVDVSAEETVTDVTDLNTATDTNVIGTYNNEEGDPFSIEETVTSATQTVADADGNTISVYTDEEGTPININETVTDLGIAAGALTYANEDASNANVNLISADADNSITAGTDGALFVDVSAEETVTDVTDLNTATDTNVIGTYNNEEGDPFSIEETVTDLGIAAGALTYANEDASNANVNLISADADNSITAGTDGALFVDVSAEETVTDVTDLNTATDTNVIGTYNNEEGDPFSIEETVTSATQTVADADGNTISVYTDEEGTPININETVTDLGIAAGALTYANEDASNANVNLISADADNSITAGTDGALFVDVSAEETVTDVTDLNTATDTNVIGTYNNEEGDPFSIEETVTSATQTVADADGNTISVYTDEEGTPININETVTDLGIAAGALTYANEDASNANVNLISTDADNSITAGTDGALFVDVSAEETVTDVTDLNTATDTNVIGTYNNEEGDPFSIEETVTSATQTVADADGNTISVYTDEEGTPININETVTDLGIAAGALTYANEDASNANVNLISADADNSITAGTDGALFVDVSAEETVTDVTDLNTATDTNVIGTYNNEEGDPFSIEETVTDLGIAAGALTYANEDASNANVNLISADADNSITAGTDGALFVDVSAEETVTDVTDLNTATDTNVIGTYNNEEGDPFSIEETVTSATQTVADADGNTISVYTDEEGTPININETVTDLGIAAGALTYANEDASNANVNLISADADNSITAGTDGALFVDVSAEETVTDVTDLNTATDTNVIGTYNNEEGDPFSIEETVTDLGIAAGALTYANEDASNANVNLISADADNSITAGTDGALFVDVSAEETVTDVTDLNTATDTNVIGTYNNEEGDPFSIEETVTSATQTVADADGNTISVYTDEEGTPININETVTDLGIAAGALTYANEDASNANVNLISTDADNSITAGTDGALFVDVSAEETVTDVTDLNTATDTNVIGTYNNEEGDPFSIEETVTSATQTVADADGNTISVYTDEEGTPININETVTDLDIAAGALTYANEDASNANVNLISADADNSITAGTDGALFVDVSAEETVTDVTDLNTATDTNVIGTYNNEEGDPFSIEETVTSATQTVADADGNTISVYTDEEGTPININETVTDLDIAAGALTYANEDASNANVNLISTDADNSITAGTDGALFVDVSAEETVTDVTDLNTATDTNVIGTYNNEEGDPFSIEETVTSATQTVADADGNTISVYTDEEGTPININETVTDLGIAAGALTYANEDASNANVNLISADADNSITAGTDGALFVDVSAEETVTDVTDLNTATDTNVIGTYNNEEGDPFSIEETVTSATQTVADADGNTISVYTDEEGTPININETVTDLDIAAGALTYANEDASNANVNLISTDADNSITAGTDGALFVDVSAEETVTDVTDLNTATDTNVIGTYNNEEGNPFSIEETVTSFEQDDTPTNPTSPTQTGEITYTDEAGNDFTAQVVSANTNNGITVGTDGGAYFLNPVRAAGKVNADGSTNKDPLNATVTRNAVGTYTISLDPAAGITDGDYIIQLTVRDSEGVGNDDYDVSYRSQTAGGFIVQVGDNDNGSGDRANRDFEFMFTVIAY